MMEEYRSRDLLRRYLLGDLEEDQREKIEARLLADEKLFDAIAGVRDEIIDDYSFDILSERDRKLFDANFVLNPERLHKLRVSTALAHYTDANLAPVSSMQASAPMSLSQRIFAGRKRWWLATAFGSVLVLLAIGYGGWRGYERYQLKKRVEELRVKQLQVEQYLAKLNGQDFSAHRDSMLSLTLQPLLRESKATNKVRISARTEVLELRLEANESNFAAYRGDIEDSDGVRLYSVENLRWRRDNGAIVVFLRLPSELLSAATYQIHLQGISAQTQAVDIGRYPFQIVFD
jgi:hypothetical protein